MTAWLSEIIGYPVKSLRGGRLETAVVEPWGLADDRRWMVIDPENVAITAREVNRMLLLRPRLVPGGVVVEADGRPELRVSHPTGAAVTVTLHRKSLRATPAGTEAEAWLSEVLGRPARLCYQRDPTTRPVNPVFAGPDDRVSLADGYPLLVTTMSSLRALNDLIRAGPHADQAPLPMARFRPNLVVEGTSAWAEDGWRRIRVGDAVFRAPKGCDRCVMTTVDPVTAVRGKEPIATLARHRRYDGATWFGMNLIPDTPAVTVRVGDEVEILESVADPDGPPR